MDYHRYTKSQLIEMLVKLKWDFEHLQAMFDRPNDPCKGWDSGWSNQYTLFQSFVNDNRKCLVLIDMSYQVCYINGAATKLLRIRTPETVYGHNIFDLIDRKDALKLKEMIDRTYLSGEEEKLASVHLKTNDGRHGMVKMSALRVKFNDQTAVRLRLKTA
jgi:transcriptional regulator with PAS, ATPase and Fis domain